MGDHCTRVFQVEGMGCSKCAEKIEKRLGKMEGVQRANVDFSNKTLLVEGVFQDRLVVEALADLGDYSLTPIDVP